MPAIHLDAAPDPRPPYRISSLCLLALLVGIPSGARGDEFSDFRIPAHRVFDWSAGFSLGGSRSSSGATLFYAESHRASGGVTTSGFWLADSDPRRTTFSVSAQAAGGRSRGNAEEHFLGTDRLEAARDRGLAESWTVQMGHRRYPWRIPLAFEIDLLAAGSYDQRWSWRASERADSLGGTRRWARDEQTTEQWRYGYFLRGSGAVGAGRVRDATGVYEALVLEQRLRRSGVLTRGLTARARQRLVALLYLRGPYGMVRERPVKGLWSEIERVLEEDGALAEGGLDAHAVKRAGEPLIGRGSPSGFGLPSSPVLRQIGFFAGAIVSGEHNQVLVRHDLNGWSQTALGDTLGPRSEFTFASRDEGHHDAISAGPRLEFHRPFGPRWQLDAASRIVFPLRREEDGMDLSSRIDLSFIAADRWYATGFVGHARSTHRDAVTGLTTVDQWGVAYGVLLVFYLEDRIQLTFSASEDQARRGGIFFGRDGFDRSGRVSLGLTYRILGGLDAPGIIDPVHIRSGDSPPGDSY